MKRNETQLNATLFISVAINNECIRLEKMKLSAVSHICGQIDWFSEWKKLLAILNYDAIFCDISRNARIMWIKLFASIFVAKVYFRSRNCSHFSHSHSGHRTKPNKKKNIDRTHTHTRIVIRSISKECYWIQWRLTVRRS